MRPRLFLALIVLAASAAWAGIVDNVRIALAQNNFSAAEGELNSYRGQRGVDGEYLEAYSWMARAALDQGQYDQAAAYANETRTLAVEQLKQRALDAEPHLPIALGAAFEVQSQVLAAHGQRSAGGCVAAIRAAGIWEYLDPRPPAEKSEPAVISGKDCADSEVGPVSGCESPVVRATQGVRRSCYFSGRTGAETARQRRRSLRNCDPSSLRRG